MRIIVLKLWAKLSMQAPGDAIGSSFNKRVTDSSSNGMPSVTEVESAALTRRPSALMSTVLPNNSSKMSSSNTVTVRIVGVSVRVSSPVPRQ